MPKKQRILHVFVSSLHSRIDRACEWYLKRSRLNKTRMALECGIDPGNLTRYRAEFRDLQISTIIRIARGLGVDLMWLATEEGPAPSLLARTVPVRHPENIRYLEELGETDTATAALKIVKA